MDNRDAAEMVVDMCLRFGTSVATAYKVAGLFVEGINQSPNRMEKPDVE
jgi:hypothetical protein